MGTKKKKLGEIIAENRSKEDAYEVHPDEIIVERDAKEWPIILNEMSIKGKQAFGPRFYIDIKHKNERLANEVERKIWIAKRVCPTPTYDQTVYRVDTEGIHFLWHVPATYVAKQMYKDMLFIPDEEKELLGYVIDFFNGSLDDLCRKENNEKVSDQPIVLALLNQEGDIHA